MPSTSKKYWINEVIPRVLTIEEFNEIIDNKIISKNNYNLIKIRNSVDKND